MPGGSGVVAPESRFLFCKQRAKGRDHQSSKGGAINVPDGYRQKPIASVEDRSGWLGPVMITVVGVSRVGLLDALGQAQAGLEAAWLVAWQRREAWGQTWRRNWLPLA